MRIRWPEGTVFTQVGVDVEQDSCERCGSRVHVCEHRIRRVYTLEGPVRLCWRLRHCADPACPLRRRTLSPRAERSVALPGGRVAWDVFCFRGHRRFARHGSVPHSRAELRDRYDIALTVAAVCKYLRRYQALGAARQQDRQQLSAAYRNSDALVLTSDGLQPETGHATLYPVREVNAQRVWFAASLLCSRTGEVCRLRVRARAIADALGKPVRMWMSDQQDAFVKGVAQVFPDAPHRYCDKHLLRELAKPMRNADSHAKVQLRKQVRGLRALERQALGQRPQAVAQPPSRKEVTAGKAGASAGPAAEKPGAARPRSSRAAGGAGKRSEPRGAPGQASRPTAKDSVAQVVLDYGAVVRGIRNADQGGPLQPTGLRMAGALREVRASRQRNLDLNKPGPGPGHLARLAGCLDRGLEAVQGRQQALTKQVEQIRAVAETLKEDNGPRWQRQATYEKLQRAYAKQGGGFLAPLAKVMRSWAGGLFVRVKVKRGEERPTDNDELERWFRRPKSHARRIPGRQHAGLRIVQEGPTLRPTLNAPEAHPQPFTAAELLPSWQALAPDGQREALHRRKIMRKARSPKSGPHRCLS